MDYETISTVKSLMQVGTFLLLLHFLFLNRLRIGIFGKKQEKALIYQVQ